MFSRLTIQSQVTVINHNLGSEANSESSTRGGAEQIPHAGNTDQMNRWTLLPAHPLPGVTAIPFDDPTAQLSVTQDIILGTGVRLESRVWNMAHVHRDVSHKTTMIIQRQVQKKKIYR